MRFSFTRRMLMAAGSALALTIAFSGTYAFAGSSTGNLSVSATVASTCTISQASALTFTGYDRASTSDLAGTGSMTIACTNGGTPLTVSFSTGANSSACDTYDSGTNTRCMSDGGSGLLQYDVYTAANHTTLFGRTGASTTSQTSTGTLTIYGLIPKNQNAPVGSYSDTLVATINY
jgi:spore coat protein U-like protein